MLPASDSSLAPEATEVPAGHRHGSGSQSLLPYLMHSLATRPAVHPSEHEPVEQTDPATPSAPSN